ncbi:hypothetical protein [Nostoc punctiforme]|uniref:hypothetical protein n=1 Tax=Nostoc punctiforme TaxID=272131 RepID=UPI000045BD32|nr:hypothetical protein [Nostoc punctiforme]
MELPDFTRVVLGLDEYLIGLDKADLEKLSVIPSVKSAVKTLYTCQGSKFIDLWDLYVDSLPWAEGEEVFLDEECE